MSRLCKALKNKIELSYLFRKKRIIPILFLFFTFFTNYSKAQSRLYLSNDDHTDYMWAANETAYDSAFVQMIDAWIANNNATNGNSPDYQTKFNCDGSYWAWAYEKSRTLLNFKLLLTR